MFGSGVESRTRSGSVIPEAKHCLHSYQYHNVCNLILIFILRDGFPCLFYIHIVGIKEYMVWGGGHLQKEEKDSKGKETRGIGGKNGNGKQKLKTYFYKLFLFSSKQRKCKKKSYQSIDQSLSCKFWFFFFEWYNQNLFGNPKHWANAANEVSKLGHRNFIFYLYILQSLYISTC